MAEVKGATKINIKGQRVGVFFTFSGHVPSPDLEGWLSQRLTTWIRPALAKEPDLAATARDPSGLAAAIMQEYASELMEQGIVGALTIDGIKVPGGAPAGASESGESPAPAPQLTPEQYASLCAERELYPAHVAQTNAKYGITDPQVAAAVDQQWQSQLQSDPSLQQRYQQAYWQYKAWLQSQQQQ